MKTERPDRKGEIADRSFTPLSEPYHAPDGLVVEAMGSIHALMDLGRHFNNALETPGFSKSVADKTDKAHVYRVLQNGVAISCGEIKPTQGGMRLEWDRGHRNAPGSPASTQAAESYVEALNAGEVEANYEVVDGAFVEKVPAPRP